jgi:hypothetical protein
MHDAEIEKPPRGGLSKLDKVPFRSNLKTVQERWLDTLFASL